MTVGEYALIEREEVLAHRLVDGQEANPSPEMEELIDTLVDSFTSVFESYCGRNFKSRGYDEQLDGDGDGILYPTHYPITAVSGIYDDDDWSWTSSSLVDSTTYLVKDMSVVMKYGYYFDEGIKNIRIVYTAGYTEVPADLKLACITEINRYIDRLHDSGMTYKLSGETAYSLIPDAWLASTVSILNKYRRKIAL
jgi:hypothetical protein